MTDEELIARLRSGDTILAEHYMNEAADRIEALIAERDTAREYAGEVRKREMAAEDARIDVADKLATCEKYRDAYDEMGRIGTQAVRDLEAKLAKAVEEAEKYKHAFSAQSRKLQAVLHIEGVKATLAEIKGESHE